MSWCEQRKRFRARAPPADPHKRAFFDAAAFLGATAFFGAAFFAALGALAAALVVPLDASCSSAATNSAGTSRMVWPGFSSRALTTASASSSVSPLISCDAAGLADFAALATLGAGVTE